MFLCLKAQGQEDQTLTGSGYPAFHLGLQLKEIQETMRALLPAISLLHGRQHHAPVGLLRSIYSEFYVAEQVILNNLDLDPQLGPQRAVKKYNDVYLPNRKLSIEVKQTNKQAARGADYAWNFTEGQGSKIPFHRLVLIGFDDLQPISMEVVFVIPGSHLPSLLRPPPETEYGIRYYKNAKLATARQDVWLSVNGKKYDKIWQNI